MKNLQAQKGFTLVEIAIVLVIIGLLLGGVLKGQELIQNSKVKSVTQDFENISAAYYAYRDRTGEYPGDTPANFFSDLRGEGFITGDATAGAAGPDHALDGVFTYVYSADGTGTTTGSQKEICASNIEAEIAENIDNKVDDGVQGTGDYQGTAAYTAATFVDLCKAL
ncbi:MAG: prepilin-type N-terminal cleavage/methylation domain-containing protein [Pseudomonadota bacterium]|nr:prepilin-type N-terminal cleavage/methylation domain-containing protein [Pseudomonadota bacterium]